MLTLENEYLKAKISPRGGELQSLCSRDGLEYIWQADPEFWPMYGPNLFPIVGHAGKRGIQIEGNVYQMPMHGFLMGMDLEVETADCCGCTLVLHSSKITHVWYPYDFVLRLQYRLEGKSLELCYTVKNTDEHSLFYGLGGHPGFRVPLSDTGKFEDCLLQFSTSEALTRVELTNSGFASGVESLLSVDGEGMLPLRHDLFDRDAVVVKNPGRTVTLVDTVCGHGVRMTAPEFPYLGLWHNPGRKAPFLCMEPWTTPPGEEVDIEDLCERADIRILKPGQEESLHWQIQVF